MQLKAVFRQSKRGKMAGVGSKTERIGQWKTGRRPMIWWGAFYSFRRKIPSTRSHASMWETVSRLRAAHFQTRRGKIMVWGSFSGQSAGQIKLIDGVMDQHVYKNTLIHRDCHTLKKHRIGYFQHGNDCKHSAKSVKPYVNGKRWSAHVLSWPQQSLHLYTIEVLWHVLHSNLQKGQNHISIIRHFIEHISNTWATIDNNTPQNLMSSIPQRCKAVLRNESFLVKGLNLNYTSGIIEYVYLYEIWWVHGLETLCCKGSKNQIFCISYEAPFKHRTFIQTLSRKVKTHIPAILYECTQDP